MIRQALVACVLCTAAAVVTVASADFVDGNTVNIGGISGPVPNTTNTYTYWGTNVSGGTTHALGSSGQQYFGDANAPTQYVIVSSVVNSATLVTFTFDFSYYAAAQYPILAFEILGLKTDGSITTGSVVANQGTVTVYNNSYSVRWDGLGASLATNPIVTLTIEQVPAPGALALLGVAGVMGTRRRRA